ncbi:hypothetical protein GCM10018966_017840 [Streptomyces yanii]
MALACLPAQNEDVAPIPGTERVEETAAAADVERSAEQIEKHNKLTPTPWPPRRGGHGATQQLTRPGVPQRRHRRRLPPLPLPLPPPPGRRR